MNISATLACDGYKTSHRKQYSPYTQVIYSTWTPRKSRMEGVNKVVVFGIQYFIKDYLIDSFNETFFNRPKDEVINEFKRIMRNYTGDDDASHWEALHDLGYLPLRIDALEEGTLCPIRVPMFTIQNTKPEFYWLTNFIETIMSTEIWKPMTSATIALEYRKILDKWAEKTCDNNLHVSFQGHDFSMRGMAGLDAACSSGAGHLLSFKGTDTIPAILWLEKYYNADCEKEIVGISIPATEHSVAETNIIEIQDILSKEKPSLQEILLLGIDTPIDEEWINEDVRRAAELFYMYRLLNVYPTGTFSYVADTYNLWEVLTEILPKLKDNIMSREGRVVIRPDSGDPCNIICGLNSLDDYMLGQQIIDDTKTFAQAHNLNITKGYNVEDIFEGPYKEQQFKGVIELLWDTFGGTINSKGYKVLDPHIGCIYGDAITLERAEEICRRLESKGFASSNVVFGIGSYTYNMNTRDTFGFALKTTYGVVNGKELMLYKDPITDNGEKKSQKGMVSVFRDEKFDEIMYKDELNAKDKEHYLKMADRFKNQHRNSEWYEMLQPVFIDGVLVRETTLEKVRNRLKEEVKGTPQYV